MKRRRRLPARNRPVPSPPLAAPGLGLDIVEIARIESLAKRNARFLRRVFTPEELRYCRSKRKPWQHLAVRFAAKEAVWKAMGQAQVALQDISVSREFNGRPGVLLKGRPAPCIQLSLSHCDHYAMAVALCLQVLGSSQLASWPQERDGGTN